MLEYDFTKHKSNAGKMVFALTLNAKKWRSVGELDLQEFSAWLVEQQGEVDGIMGEVIT